MGAAGKKCHEDHQVRQCKQPLIRLHASRFRSPGDESQMAPLSEIPQVIQANPGQAGDFRICKDLLARFDGDHGLVPLNQRRSMSSTLR